MTVFMIFMMCEVRLNWAPRDDLSTRTTLDVLPWTGLFSRQGFTNLSEPESYFLGTESFEGQPLCYTVLK